MLPSALAFADFAARFALLYAYPTTRRHDAIALLQKIEPPSAQRLAAWKEKGAAAPAAGYHTDTRWRLLPASGAVLKGVKLPEVGGGDIIWVDAGLAYEGLADALMAKLDGLYVPHDFRDALIDAGHHRPSSPIRRCAPIGRRGGRSCGQFHPKAARARDHGAVPRTGGGA